MNSIITLATDFGLDDEYVGVMKGVILSRAPAARIVDLSHSIGRHNLASAAYLIEAAYRYFPPSTVHVAVIDPGVGTARRIVTLAIDSHVFLGPDNGIFTLLLAGGKFEAAYEVTCTPLFRQPVSNTFHGRDIMAPVAAHLARGLAPAEVGPPLARSTLVTLPLPQATIKAAQGIIQGEVVHVDNFGNLTTNISYDAIRMATDDRKEAEQALVTEIHGQTCQGLQTSYEAAPPGAIVALIGSRNYVEIAANRDSAARLLRAGPGTPVEVRRFED